MFTINDLPIEILQIFLSHLSPRELLNAEKVNRWWRQAAMAPALWRGLIRQYFPYLVEQKSQQYIDAPRALFFYAFGCIEAGIKENPVFVLGNIEVRIKNIPEYASIRPYILASLHGDIAKIEEAEINEEAKTNLYVIAAASGHLKGVEKLNDLGKREALILAARVGCLSGCKVILSHASQTNLDKLTGWMLQRAAEHGHLDVVQYLLTHQDITTRDKRFVLSEAAKNGQLAVVQYFLTYSRYEIDVGGALYAAAKNGQLSVVQYMLSNTDWWQISSSVKPCILCRAAENGHLNVVEYILTHFGQDITTYAQDAKDVALSDAAKNGHLNVVKYLLAQETAQQISAKTKAKILKDAARSGHQDVVSFLLKRYGHELPTTAVIEAVGLVRACKFYAARTATAIGNMLTSFTPPAPIEEPVLLPMTTQPLTQQSALLLPVTQPLTQQAALFPLTTQEVLTNAPKRKLESGLENSSNGYDADDDASPQKKCVKLR